jgi:hypothetical protein
VLVAVLIIIVNCLLTSVCPAEEAFTVKVEVAAALGVPEITPADDKVKPAGKVPLAKAQVTPVAPVAVKV